MLTSKLILAQSEDEYMSDAQQDFFKNLLLEKMAHITKRMRAGQDSLNIERHADAADTASVEENRSLSLNMAVRDNQEITRIKRALSVLADGDYGYCLESGEEIGIKRLLAVPESLYSVESMRVIEAKLQHQRGAA